MQASRWIAIVLAVLTLPVFVIGLIDPLEGGIALLAIAAMGLIVGVLSRMAPPKLLWISLVATVTFGVIVIVIAVSLTPVMMAPGAGTAEITVGNPMPWLILPNWLWRIGVVVTAVGWVMWVVRLIRRARAER